MSLVVNDNGKSYTPPPVGTHVAICRQIIDIGTQHSPFYNQWTKKVLIGWELPHEMNDDDEPFLIWNRYTASLNEKARLRTDLESWRGRVFTEDELRGFELRNIIGKGCMLSVLHEENNGKTYARVKAVMSMPKGQSVPAPHHREVVFDLDDWNEEVFKTFNEKLQETIKKSKEYQEHRNGPLPQHQNIADAAPIDDSDIPF